MAVQKIQNSSALKTRDLILSLLKIADYTVAEISLELKLHRNTVDYHLRRAHEENKVHVFDWNRCVGIQGSLGAIYRLGEGEDKPKPNRMSQRVYDKRYYRKHHTVMAARRAAKAGTLNPFTQLVHEVVRGN
jgi:DNA-binding CsgD family transcriptional regulator